MLRKILAMALVLGMTSASHAQRPEGKPDGERKRPAPNANGKAPDAQARRGAGGQRPGGPNGERPAMDPEQLVKRMMEKFDKDGDAKLDAKELTALLTSMRERGGMGMMRGAEGDATGRRRGANGERPAGRPGAGRPGGSDTGGEPGGDRPRRPGGKDSDPSAS